ncbi:MAG: hypothetical protein ACE14M_03005 [Terriglobales bacterium]
MADPGLLFALLQFGTCPICVAGIKIFVAHSTGELLLLAGVFAGAQSFD